MTPPSSHTPGSSGTTITSSPPPEVPDFTLARQIGRGSYGDVWLARDALGYWRALKVVRRDRFEQDAQYDREFTGISAYAPLSHAQPTLLRLLHVGRNEGYFYYAMELADDAGTTGAEGRPSPSGNADDVAGATYAREFSPETYQPKTLRHVQRQRGRLPLAECLKIGRELVAALGHLHSRGLAHRDVKPSNVVFVRDEAKLADMGLVSSSDRTLTQGVGTAGYLAPEGGGTPTADFYALGKVLYELITGCDRMKFPDLPPLRDLPEAEQRGIRELNTVVLKACDPKPERRYRNAAEFDGELAALEAGHSLDLQRRVVRQLKRVAAVLALLAVVGALVGGWQWQQSRNFQSQEKARELARLNGIAQEKLLTEVKALGGKGRVAGWTTNAAAKLREAMTYGSVTNVTELAAHLLVGVEARLHWVETDAETTALAWDAAGGRLLLSGSYSNSSRNPGSPTRVYDLRTNGCAPISSSRSPGPVAWRPDGVGLQFRFGSSRSRGLTEFYLKEYAPTTTVVSEWPSTGIRLAQSAVAACSANGRYVAYSGLARREASEQTDEVLVVLDAGGRSLVAQTNLLSTSLAFSPDGSFLAAGRPGGRVEIFHLPEFDSVASIDTDQILVEALAFGRNPLPATNAGALAGWRLATGSRTAVIQVWDLALQRLVSRLRGSSYAIHALAFSPDGALLASGGRGLVLLWDIANEEQILSLPGHWGISMDYVMSLAFSPDGRFLAGGSGRSSWAPASTWVAEISRHRGVQPLYGLGGQVEQAWLSPDGEWLAALSHEWRLGVWETKTGRLRHVLRPPFSGFPDNADLVFHPDGKIYFASGPEAKVWDTESGKLVRAIPLKSGLGDRMRLLADRRMMLIRRERKTVGNRNAYDWVLRDLHGAEPSVPLHRQADDKWSGYVGDISPDGKYFVVVGNTIGRTNAQLELLVAHDLKTGAELWRTSLPNISGGSRWVEFSADGTAVRFTRYSETYQWHALADGRVLSAEPWRPSPLCTVLLFNYGELRRVELLRPGTTANPLALGADYPTTASYPGPRFCADGRLLAWSTTRGVPVVADLPEIARQLKAMGYEW